MVKCTIKMIKILHLFLGSFRCSISKSEFLHRRREKEEEKRSSVRSRRKRRRNGRGAKEKK